MGVVQSAETIDDDSESVDVRSDTKGMHVFDKGNCSSVMFQFNNDAKQ